MYKNVKKMSEIVCINKNCKETSRTSQLQFFRFPRTPKLYDIWLERSGRKHLMKKSNIHQTYFLCEKHFDNLEVLKSGKKRLPFDAIPLEFGKFVKQFPSTSKALRSGLHAETPQNSSKNERTSISSMKLDSRKSLNSKQIGKETTLEEFKDVSPTEIAKYQNLYPQLEDITERRLHCTSCNSHIGTAPINEAILKMHPVLRVIQCKKCYTFYTSGGFELGEDGSEFYCRWCGQGGEVYCCSKCPYVFCRRCIEHNLSTQMVDDIQNNENWKCFICAPACMLQLKADFWALLNFIEKQKKEIATKTLTEKELNEEMSKDLAKCCQTSKKRTYSKRKLDNSTDTATPPPKKHNMDASKSTPTVKPTPPPKKHMLDTSKSTPPEKPTAPPKKYMMDTSKSTPSEKPTPPPKRHMDSGKSTPSEKPIPPPKKPMIDTSKSTPSEKPTPPSKRHMDSGKSTPSEKLTPLPKKHNMMDTSKSTPSEKPTPPPKKHMDSGKSTPSEKLTPLPKKHNMMDTSKSTPSEKSTPPSKKHMDKISKLTSSEKSTPPPKKHMDTGKATPSEKPKPTLKITPPKILNDTLAKKLQNKHKSLNHDEIVDIPSTLTRGEGSSNKNDSNVPTLRVLRRELKVLPITTNTTSHNQSGVTVSQSNLLDVHTASTTKNPVFHTINGFRVDLNTASQQETYRLPNGKLIQVRKQTPNSKVAVPATLVISTKQATPLATLPISLSNPATAAVIAPPTAAVVAPATAVVTPPTTVVTPATNVVTSVTAVVTPATVVITPAPAVVTPTPVVVTPALPVTTPVTPVQASTLAKLPVRIVGPINRQMGGRPRLITNRGRGRPRLNRPVRFQAQQLSQMGLNSARSTANPITTNAENEIHITSLSDTLPRNRNQPPPLANRSVPENSPADRAKTQFEIRVENSMEVCQHIIGKMKTLTNSTAYKSVKTVADVKDLTIHLSYLLTYAVGRFKTLHEKCGNDMKTMGFDADPKGDASDDDDDDIQILEPNTTLIDLDSDEDMTNPSNEARRAVETLLNVENIETSLPANISDPTPIVEVTSPHIHENGETSEKESSDDVINITDEEPTDKTNSPNNEAITADKSDPPNNETSLASEADATEISNTNGYDIVEVNDTEAQPHTDKTNSDDHETIDKSEKTTEQNETGEKEIATSTKIGDNNPKDKLLNEESPNELAAESNVVPTNIPNLADTQPESMSENVNLTKASGESIRNENATKQNDCNEENDAHVAKSNMDEKNDDVEPPQTNEDTSDLNNVTDKNDTAVMLAESLNSTTIMDVDSSMENIKENTTEESQPKGDQTTIMDVDTSIENKENTIEENQLKGDQVVPDVEEKSNKDELQQLQQILENDDSNEIENALAIDQLNNSSKTRTNSEITINVSNIENIDEDIFENLIEEVNEMGENTNEAASFASDANYESGDLFDENVSTENHDDSFSEKNTAVVNTTASNTNNDEESCDSESESDIENEGYGHDENDLDMSLNSEIILDPETDKLDYDMDGELEKDDDEEYDDGKNNESDIEYLEDEDMDSSYAEERGEDDSIDSGVTDHLATNQ